VCLKGKAGDLGEVCLSVIPGRIAGGPLLRERRVRDEGEGADRWVRELSERGGGCLGAGRRGQAVNGGDARVATCAGAGQAG